MTVDPRKRQKKLEKKAAKDKARKKLQLQRGGRDSNSDLRFAASAPILDCFVQEVIWEEGIGTVLLSRRLPLGVAFATFLVDIFCLGVKDASSGVLPRLAYSEKLHDPLAAMGLEEISPAAARKLVEGAVQYARGLGLAPHPDYEKAKVIFGDIDAGTCTESFEYGRDGKPFFVAGPHDTPARCQRIIAALADSCGAGNFDYVVGFPGVPGVNVLRGIPNLEGP